jgi:hypothetical protein
VLVKIVEEEVFATIIEKEELVLYAHLLVLVKNVEVFLLIK